MEYFILGIILCAYAAQLARNLAYLNISKFDTKKEFWLNMIPAYPIYEDYKKLD